MTGAGNVALELWSDEPSAVDLLAFAAVAETVVDAVLDDALDPVALGVSGSWGSGKTTVLRLVEIAVSRPPKEGEGKVLAVATDPWRYDPTVGAKESLIAGVLDALQSEIIDTRGPAAEALGLLRRLARRVDWAKAIKVAAKASLAFQLPSVNDITDLIRTVPEDGGESEPRGLEEFREEFSTLMASEDLGHVRRVVVLVDDLDRCLPDTVVETLETIRLFLAVPKMAFVIAADEERVAEAIRQRYPGSAGDDPEEPAKLYLHKIVQTTIPLPSLSRFDTEAYLLLLQLGNRLTAEQLEAFVDQCGTLRLRSATLDDLPGVDGVSIAEELTFAARLTPMLYEKLRGNPRRIKRFLNDLRVRQSIAKRRGIALAPDVVAKLMVLEVLLGDEFTKVLDWLATGNLRAEMQRLEVAAGRAKTDDPAESASTDQPETGIGANSHEEAGRGFSDDLLRWAKLPPELRAVDLAPYLYLAASVSGVGLLDSGLPGRLRDIAANLTSSVRAEQKSVSDDDLQGLTDPDAIALVQHLARVGRDRPSEQVAATTGLLRVCRLRPNALGAAVQVLRSVPADDLEPATILLFSGLDGFQAVVEKWTAEVTRVPNRNALKTIGGA